MLTADDVARFQFSGHTLRFIKTAVKKIGVPLQSARILDYGCGRGMTVAKLREQGLEVYGADIDPQYIANGRPLLAERDSDPNDVLRVIDNHGSTGFPDGFFDIVISNQVLEHVEDLDIVAAELRRVMAPGAVALHVFPSKWRLIETHLFMPAVHWLPKSQWRKTAISLCLAIGVGPRWKELEGLSRNEVAEVLYRYSVGQTFYRRVRAIRNTFGSVGFDVRWLTPGRVGVLPFMNMPFVGNLLRFGLRHFWNVGVVLTRTEIAASVTESEQVCVV